MPTYRNTDSIPHVLPGYPCLEPGEDRETYKYVWPIPSGIQLVSHEPRTNTPVTIYSDTLPSGDINTLPAYASITINNETGGDVTIVFNEDTDNPLVLPPSAFLEIDLDDDYYVLSATSTGGGKLHIMGFRSSDCT
jgi:hypothetical protein